MSISTKHSIDAPIVTGGNADSVRYGDDHTPRFSSNPQVISSNAQLHYETSLIQQNQFSASSSQPQVPSNDAIGLALGPPLNSSFKFQLDGQPTSSSNLNPYYDWSHQRQNDGVDDYLAEEEIRRRSHEVLEHEDMQLLLRHLSMVGSSNNIPKEGYGFPSYVTSPSPAFNFHDDQSRSSGKAVVGWLKIKAAMRWGIFIRKRAAEKRRAQIVELED